MTRHTSTPCRNPRRFRGFSMIELMVAVLVLSVGLLGMAALQGVSLRNNQSANFRSQATNLSYQMIDMARVYNGRTADDVPCSNVRTLVAPLSSWTATCAVGSAPEYACESGDASLACDRRRWAQDVCETLPNGRARVTLTCPLGVTPQLDVELCWTDNRASDDEGSADCTAASEGFGELGRDADGAERANNAFWMTSSL